MSGTGPRSEMANPSVAVVHLIRGGNPVRFLDRFLESYDSNTAGVAHELVFLLKGISGAALIQTREELQRRYGQPLFIEIDDTGFDIGAYKHAAERIDQEFVVYLNSHSKIEADDWLAKLIRPFATHGGTGVVGATASWEQLDASTPFPNVHVRTNGFAIRRNDFLSIEAGPLDSKLACNRFEAGPRSMTRQLIERGQAAYVVGRDGRIFDEEAWPTSRTFRSGNQENLLISDNRTRQYQLGSSRHRSKVAALSWDNRAEVTPLTLWQTVNVLARRIYSASF